MKQTPGPWTATVYDDGRTDHRVSVALPGFGAVICRTLRFDQASAEDAKLIAEAGTVAHETGLWPRRLAEDRTALLKAIERLINSHTGAAWQDEGVRRAAWVNVRETVENVGRPM